jgi:hypothetical protein
MEESLEGRRAVIVSDNELLTKAIEVCLADRWQMDVIEPPADLVGWPSMGLGLQRLDLIVVAVSAWAGEPLLALVRASLARQIGRVPILVVSERRFESHPNEKILHLGFPFDSEELHEKVGGLLQVA